jgi:hypothetical protein
MVVCRWFLPDGDWRNLASAAPPKNTGQKVIYNWDNPISEEGGLYSDRHPPRAARSSNSRAMNRVCIAAQRAFSTAKKTPAVQSQQIVAGVSSFA